MSFDFCCSCDSYSYPYAEEHRIARKQHKCGECFGPIASGERYWYAHGLCEGEWFDAKVCARCEDLYAWVKAHIPCVCVAFGNMHEELLACAEEANIEAPGVYFGALRRYAKIRQAKATAPRK